MGSTVVTDVVVGATFDAAGQPFYVMWEASYPKNVYPHIPEYSPIAFGRARHVLEKIFGIASECEGGMIQGKSGFIRPETYLARAMKAFLHPKSLPHDMDFKISEKTIKRFDYRVIEDKVDPVVERIVADHFGNDVLDEIRSGKRIKLIASDHFDFLVKLADADVSGHRLFDIHPPYMEAMQKIISLPKAKAVRPEAMPNRLLKLGGLYIDALPDGAYKILGDRFSLVQHFVSNLWRHELESSGLYKSAMKEFREKMEQASPVVDEGLVFKIKDVHYDKTWKNDALKRVVDAFGGNRCIPIDREAELVVKNNYLERDIEGLADAICIESHAIQAHQKDEERSNHVLSDVERLLLDRVSHGHGLGFLDLKKIGEAAGKTMHEVVPSFMGLLEQGRLSYEQVAPGLSFERLCEVVRNIAHQDDLQALYKEVAQSMACRVDPLHIFMAKSMTMDVGHESSVGVSSPSMSSH